MGWVVICLGIALIGIGTFFTIFGKEMLSNKPTQTIISPQKILSPQAEKLLSIIYKYQKEFSRKKLIIGREGILYFDEPEMRNKYKINILGEVYDISSNYTAREAEFEALILDIPAEFLRQIPEMRLDSPYVVSITDEGIKYLKSSSKELSLESIISSLKKENADIKEKSKKTITQLQTENAQLKKQESENLPHDNLPSDGYE